MHFHVTTVAVEKQQVLHTLNVQCVALFIEHAKRMRRITLAPVACLAVPYFSTPSHKNTPFFEKKY
jgi:hypothetical protein